MTERIRQNLIESLEHAISESSLEDVLHVVKEAYIGLDAEFGDETDYYRLNAESVRDLIESLP